MRLTYCVILILIFLLGFENQVFASAAADTAQKSKIKKSFFYTAGFGIAASGAALIFDKPVERNLRQAQFSRNSFVVAGDYSRSYFLLGVPLLTLAAGRAVADDYLIQSSFRAGAASATAFLFTAGLKFTAGRVRPQAQLNPFDFRGFNKNEFTSFVSGHSSVAFSLAAVFSQRYSGVVFLPPVLYSCAGLIALSRVAAGEHWLSDVTAGAALGLTTGVLINALMENCRINIFPAVTPRGEAGISLTARF